MLFVPLLSIFNKVVKKKIRHLSFSYSGISIKRTALGPEKSIRFMEMSAL